MSSDEFIVTPWHVEGDIDYDKLIEKFGTQKISPELLEKIRSMTNEDHFMLRRGIFFSHREMNRILEKLYNDKIILDHGLKVAQELSYVLSGGDTSIDKTLSEDDLYKLELDAFMRLIENKDTQDRIKHTLATGKPLVN